MKPSRLPLSVVFRSQARALLVVQVLPKSSRKRPHLAMYKALAYPFRHRAAVLTELSRRVRRWIKLIVAPSPRSSTIKKLAIAP